jgi:hypothetical protein
MIMKNNKKRQEFLTAKPRGEEVNYKGENSYWTKSEEKQHLEQLAAQEDADLLCQLATMTEPT